LLGKTITQPQKASAVSAQASPRKVLFVAEAVTLAHVVRLVTLATALHHRGWQVTLATDSRYASVVGPLPFPTVDLFTMPAVQFQRAISRGSPIFDFETLDRYVRDDLALLERVQPDVVVGDFRISLAVSARVAGVRYINLTNAYWSPLAQIDHIVPEFYWVRWTGTRVGQVLFDAFRRTGYARHVLPVNRVRRKYGLPPIGGDFRDALMDGDVTLFADLPQIIPTDPLPAHQHFIGPVPWSPPVPLPSWWDQFQGSRHKRPVIYVTLGSSGPPDVLQRVLDGLANADVDVIASTAGRARLRQVPANARVADLLPGDQVCEVADLVICNGGSPGTYQALSHGKPVIGLVTNLDQFLNMAAVQRAGCGLLLRTGSTATTDLKDVLSALGRHGACGAAARACRDATLVRVSVLADTFARAAQS